MKDKFGQGKRNFFFQCFNGHWDEAHQKFKFGPHPKQLFGGVNGVQITDDNKVHIVEDDELEKLDP